MWELYNFSNITWLMFAIVRAFVGLILMKNTHAPVSCISFVSVINTLGFVLMLVACAPPGPSLTCSTVIKIVKKKLVYFVMLRLNIHYKPNLFGKVHSFPIIDQWGPAVWFTWSLLHCSKLWLEETIMMMMIKNITLLRSLPWCRCEHNDNKNDNESYILCSTSKHKSTPV